MESEKKHLSQECEDLKEQLHDLRVNAGGSDSETGSGTGSGIPGHGSESERRVRELEENVRMKNKQIHQLLQDIEQVIFYFLIIPLVG